MKRAFIKSLTCQLLAASILSFGCSTFNDPIPAGNANYVKFIGGAKDETVHRGLQYSDGGYILAGESNSFLTEGTDAYMARTDDSGNLLWEKTFGGSGADGFSDIKEVDGNLMAFGYVTDDSGQRDFLLMQLDEEGTILDSLTFGSTDGDETGRFLLPGSSGGYTLLGVESVNETSTDIYTVRLSDAFEVEWTKSFGLLEKLDEIGNVVELPSGNLMWSGTINSGTSSHTRVVSTSPYGQPVWAVSFGEDDTADESGLMLTKGWGSYYVLLSNSDDNLGDITLRFIDQHGTQIGTTQTYDTGSDDTGRNICLTSDGGYAIAGTTEVGLDDTDVLLIKTDAAGNEVWSQNYGGSGADAGSFVVEDRDLGLTIFSTITFENNTVFGLIKTDSDGNTY
ncbi:MAG: hypothetical protein WBB45_06135 [Cyclobacteriaceae bacterium]